MIVANYSFDTLHETEALNYGSAHVTPTCSVQALDVRVIEIRMSVDEWWIWQLSQSLICPRLTIST
jgi:hypothetical protein